MLHVRLALNTALKVALSTIPTIEYGGRSIMLLECSSAQGTGRLHCIKQRMNEAVYCYVIYWAKPPSLSQSVEDWSWLGLLICQRPKAHSWKTKEWLQKEAYQDSGVTYPVSRPKSNRKSLKRAGTPYCSATVPKPDRTEKICMEEWANPCCSMCKPGQELQEPFDLCNC